MSNINILSPHVADLIAAGEVVERPASAVKELAENAIDAGAKNITIEIRGGGMTYIRVSDDGCGMSPEDAGVAFLRHATSKLRDERGLESIATLGFRGEALAAISAVSKIELRTRRKNDTQGTRVVLTAGDIDEMGPVGCPEGTTMIIENLFYNTPARLKFMKSDKAEASACLNAALKCALAHPEVSVRAIRDGEEVFFSPGDGQIKSCIYTLLGRDVSRGLIECSGGDEAVKVTGYISAPHAGRGNRAMQYFFVNGRPFKSAAIQAALEQAYKNSLLTGRFPAAVLYIELGFGQVDVNVHPAKTEVKFSEEKRVFDAVYYSVLSALSAQRETAEITLSETTRRVTQPKADFYKTMTSEEYRRSGIAEKAEKAAAKPAPTHTPVQTKLDLGKYTLREESSSYTSSRIVPKPEIPEEVRRAVLPETVRKAAPAAAPKTDVSVAPVVPETPAAPSVSAPAVKEDKTAVKEDKPTPAPAAPIVVEEEKVLPDFRIIGEAMNTYILVEVENSLLMIDKHAAHERMIFDRLKTQGGEIMSQTLLEPVTLAMDAESIELIEHNADAIAALGFEIEPFGAESVIIRALPADTDGGEAALVEELVEKLRRGGLSEGRDEILHTVACKAAIKAGWKTDDLERRKIAEKVISGEVKYCPHGRPVAVTLTKAELDKQFKRIV
ncbi:MAG: DNA mismatch repair endonuclease MutL [Oscillospiraceae bacterium]|nr:DNA mismatch repair endonuclease MutL [Oscillospiraceae bacterium]